QVQIDASTTDFTQEAHKVLQRAPEPIDAPSGYQVDFAPRDRFQHLVECRPLVAALGATYPRVREFLHDIPTVTLRGRRKLATLVLNGLPVSADAKIERHSLGLCHSRTLTNATRSRVYAEIKNFLHGEFAHGEIQVSCGVRITRCSDDFCIGDCASCAFA